MMNVKKIFCLFFSISYQEQILYDEDAETELSVPIVHTYSVSIRLYALT